METWLIIVIAIVVLALVALLVLLPRMRNNAKKQEQAREHIRDAQLHASRAEQEQAAAQEQVAAARRERAEVEERAVLADREAQQRLAHARDEQARANSLHERAEQLDPGSTERTQIDPAPDGTHADHAPGEPVRQSDDPGPNSPRG